MKISLIKLKKIMHLTILDQFYFYFIFFFLIPFYQEEEYLKSFKYFQRLKLQGNNILLPNENAINVLGNEFNFIGDNDYIEFIDENLHSKVSLANSSDLEYFSISQFVNYYYILLNVMDQYYLLDETGKILKQILL